tara:strand:+ start:363 stop:539 length:177 start_codon:yes stop_codon:yes gene_type:complete
MMPVVTPNGLLKPGTEMRNMDLNEEAPSSPLKTPMGPDEESAIYIDEMFALTVAKRKV